VNRGWALLLLLVASPLCAEEAEESVELPYVRLELSARGGAPIRAKIKKGRDAEVQAFQPSKDAHLPNTPTWGVSGELDVQPLEWASVGILYWELRHDGPRRSIHYEGLSLGGRTFSGRTQLNTRIQIRFAEVSLRYVWKHTPRVRLWFGLGAAWISYRIALRGDRLRATARIEDFLAPSLSYQLEARLGAWATLFFTSGIAVSPQRFPGLTSRLRVGLRWHIAPHLELVTGLGLRNGFLGEFSEQVGKDVRSGHRWRRVRFSALGFDVGLAFTL
jgi:hypothetical protein